MRLADQLRRLAMGPAADLGGGTLAVPGVDPAREARDRRNARDRLRRAVNRGHALRNGETGFRGRRPGGP